MPSSKNIAQLIQEDNRYLEIKKPGLPLVYKNDSDTRFSKTYTLVFEIFFSHATVLLPGSINNTLYPNDAHLGKIQLPEPSDLM